jgi:hypothetical protein
MNVKDPAIRRYVYGIVAAVIPLLLLTGLITPDAVTPILNAAAAVLGLGAAGLALPNTPKGSLPANEAATEPPIDAPRHSAEG